MDFYSKTREKLNITDFNEMQKQAFELISKGGDTLLLSATGSGKTIAFLLPIFKQLDKQAGHAQLLIITPTRELALQIDSVTRNLALGIHHTVCYGGHPIRFEKKNLESGPSMIVGTPGRILDHLERNSFDPLKIKYLVFDEFDKTLEMGFHKQIESIIAFMKYKPQYVLTSATSGIEIPSFVPLYQNQTLDFTQVGTIDSISLYKVISPEKDKIETLISLLLDLSEESSFVFVNYRETTQRISTELKKRKIDHDVFHGGLDQKDREIVLSKFRNGSTKTLVSTDLAARGLDIQLIDNVIHYHLPIDEETFIHRNGRTGRMHATGTVYTIIHPDEELPAYIENIEQIHQPNGKSQGIKGAEWKTIRISKGKKDKIRKIDVVGFLIKVGSLEKDDIGLIEVKDHFILVAVRNEKAELLRKKVDREKIKGKKVAVTIL